jgi:hypothetical protein
MVLLYPDVSHWDWDRRGGNLDWVTLNAPVVCIRATYGNRFQETRHFVEMATGAREAGSLVGGYHNLVAGDIAEQVAYFREQLTLANARWAMLDVEPYAALVTAGRVPQWSDVVAFHHEWARVSRIPLVTYLARYVWSDWLGTPDLALLPGLLVSPRYTTPVAGSLVDIWAASDQVAGWTAYGGKAPDVWQFTSRASVPGASETTDVNAYRGTVAEFRAAVTAPGGTSAVIDALDRAADNRVRRITEILVRGTRYGAEAYKESP